MNWSWKKPGWLVHSNSRPGYPEFCPAFEDRMNSQASKSSLRFGTRGLLDSSKAISVSTTFMRSLWMSKTGEEKSNENERE